MGNKTQKYKNIRGNWGQFWLALSIWLLTAVAGQANTYNFWTTNAAAVGTGAGSGVALEVTFITNTDQIVVRITNLELDPIKETQAVASVDFLVQGMSGIQPSAVALTNTTYTNVGYVVNFAAKGDTHYSVASITTAPTTAWGISTTTNLLSGGTQITAISGGSPDYLIIGKSTNTTQYVGANTAVTGHSPFLGTDPNDYIEFTLTYAHAAGITSTSQISTTNAPVVDFGTAFLAGQELVLTDQPEPNTVVMMILAFGLFPLGTIVRTRMKHNEEKHVSKG